MITIYWNDWPIKIYKSTAAKFGIKDGYIVKTENEFIEILEGKLRL